MIRSGKPMTVAYCESEIASFNSIRSGGCLSSHGTRTRGGEIFNKIDFSSLYQAATYKVREYPASSDCGEVVYGSAPCPLTARMGEDWGDFYHELKQ